MLIGHPELITQEQEIRGKKKDEKVKAKTQKQQEAENIQKEHTQKKEAEDTEDTRLQELKQMSRFTINSQWNTVKQKHGLGDKKQ